MTKLQALVFDFGGVLLDWHPRYYYAQILGEAGAEAFINETGLIRWYWEQDRGRTFAEGEAELIHKFPQHAHLIRAFKPNWFNMMRGEVAGMGELVATLARQGIPLYGLTNFSAEMWPLAYPRYPILQHFRDIVVSGRERCAKPEPQIYEIMKRRMPGIDPARTLFIDDRQENVDGAKASGIPAVRFIDAATLHGQLRHHGVQLDTEQEQE